MMDHYYAVIMAGGGGTRLWPLSRQSCPKQMLPLVEKRSLFQIAVDRLDGIFLPEQIFVVTVAEQAEELQNQCPQIPPANYLLEPMPRGTASVVGLAAVALQQRDPQAVMAVLTADHIFKNQQHFQQLLLAAYDAAQQDHLVTLGISPTYPATGYGYIQQGDEVDSFRGLRSYQVLRFKEKPNEEDARTMIACGDHAWNSGMFVWRVERILAEFAHQMPDLTSKLDEISGNWNQPQCQEVIQQLWPQIHPQTIDYGIMENARDVVVIPAEGLGWNDVGSWEALFDVISPGEDGNIFLGDGVLSVDTKNSLVYTQTSNRLVVTIGVDDLVVVETDDVIMVCKKDQAQKVRQIVEQLKEKDSRYI
jgi:mannose-1-phosphate guanylyltransferase